MGSYDPELTTFETSPAAVGGGLNSMLVPILIGFLGVALGGAALYFSLTGSRETGAAQRRLEQVTAKAEGLETRIRDLEVKYTEQATKLAAVEKQSAQMTSEINGTFRQVGVEINRNRTRIDQSEDELAELFERVNRTGFPIQQSSARVDSASPPSDSPATSDPTGTARARLPRATVSDERDQGRDEAVIGAEDRSHTIRSGDTFTKLSQQYGVSVAAILAANPDVDPRRLAVGQKITIPAN